MTDMKPCRNRNGLPSKASIKLGTVIGGIVWQVAIAALFQPSVLGQTHTASTAPANSDESPRGTAAPVDPDAGDAAAVDSPEFSSAEVIEVSGSVEQAEDGVSVLVEEGWKAVAVGDRLASGTQLRTGLRSYANLRFGETTVLSVRSATHASIDEFYRSATAESVRIGLGYGTVQGSSSEGVLRSDVTVDSTIATLAKRGTEGWEMSVEPMTGRFKISLARSGLVDAIRKARAGRSVSRTVAPGEYATSNNIANLWIAQAVFDRNVTFYESAAMTASDAEFTTSNDSGLAVVAAGAGSQLTNVNRRASGEAIFRQASTEVRGAQMPNTVVVQPGLLPRREGNFGTPDTFRLFLPQEKGNLSTRYTRSLVGRGVRR